MPENDSNRKVLQQLDREIRSANVSKDPELEEEKELNSDGEVEFPRNSFCFLIVDNCTDTAYR
jgi:hypothetical protein